MITLKLKELLDERNLTRYWLSVKIGIKYQTIDGYYKNKVVRYDSYILNKICEALDCTPGDLINYQKDETN